MAGFLRVLFGLLLVIGANIPLGSIGAILDGTFDIDRFRKGAFKGGVVMASILAVYIAGRLNPDLLVIDAGGETLNLMSAINVLLLCCYTAYGIDVMKKLRDILLQNKEKE